MLVRPLPQRIGVPIMVALLLSGTAGAAYAQDQAVETPAPPPATQGDPDAPMSDIPDFGVDWPDLGAGDAIDPNAPSEPDLPTEHRYSVRLDGLDEIDADVIRSRFNILSALAQGKGKSANAAQIDRRAKEDEELLATLMRAAGYYDARIDTRSEADAEGRVLVILDVRPGNIYRFTQVELRGLDEAGDKAPLLEKTFDVKRNDVVDADKVVAGEAALVEQLGEQGFPFAKVQEPGVVVDHEDRSATLVLNVDTGGARNFGRIIKDDPAVFSARHVQTIARFDPGDPYDSRDIDDLRRALVATGLVSTAKVETVPGSTPDTVDVKVAIEPAPPRTIAGEIGYGTGEGARLEASWQHRNLLPPEGAVTVRGVIGTQEQLLSTTLRRSNFGKRDRTLNAQIAAQHVDRKAYEARTFSVSGSLERQSNLIFQKKWTWSVGAEMLASDERDVVGATDIPRRRTFFIAALPSNVLYDASDDLLDPTRGFRLGARVSPEASFQNGSFGYVKAQIDAVGYFPAADNITIAARTRLGTIYGADRDRIAPSRRFYAGGGGSVRGYGYQSIGPRDLDNDPVGGKSLAEFSLEGRIRFGNFGVVPFVDAGNISTDALPNFSKLRFGAGIGARYYTNFGPIRIDVGTPINPQPGDPRVAVYVSLGQAF